MTPHATHPHRSHHPHRPALAAWGLAQAFAWVCAVALSGVATPAKAQATFVQTPYQNPKALVDVYLDHPAKMGAALYWVRSLVNPLVEPPYSMLPEDMSVIVLLHGTELVTVARKNEATYADVVQRMRYYASQGVKFKVCGLALKDFGYTLADMQDFIEVTPSAMSELVHWQNQGYGLITPVVMDKKLSTDDIR
ncbi:MAG: DsrE family protein [Burkholderiaceae bacterium]